MHRAGFTNRTEDACHSRWDRKLKARNPNLKPKAWSAEEDKRLIQLVTNFPWRNTHNGWLKISEHMSPRRAPEPCRDRWHKPLRGPANSGELTDEEKKLLVDLDSRNYGIFEMVDLLERDLRSFRDPEYVEQAISGLRRVQPVTRSQEPTVNWGPAENDILIKYHKDQGRTRNIHKSSAAHLNDALRTNIFTPAECERHWNSTKLKRYRDSQQRG